jgi:iron complex transport system permease protein
MSTVSLPKPTSVTQPKLSTKTRSLIAIPTLLGVLIVAMVVGVMFGAVSISPWQVFSVIVERVSGISLESSVTEQQELVLWTIRLPRVILAALIGAGLGMAGAGLQGVFRNPLADPGLIGVSSGAAVGAVGAIVSGVSLLGRWTIPVAAFGGALLVTVMVFRAAHRNGRVEVVTLVLCGVGVNALCWATIGLLTSMADDAELRDITFWQLGSVGGATWEVVLAVLPFVTIALLLMPRMARTLDLFVLGEREARHLGVHVDRVRLLVIVLAAMAAGASAAVAGIVGFVGLIVPHMIRLAIGPGHRVLLPASAIGGAAVLVLADLIARTIAAPQEVPLGVMTAFLGAPTFLLLIRRSQRANGGFA